MTRKPFFLAIPLLLTQCGTMGRIKNGAYTATSKVAHLARSSVTNLTAPDVPVVKVRSRDLRDLPLGKERVVALEAQRKQSFFARNFSPTPTGSFSIQQPKLPDSAPDATGTLLPPKDF